MEKIATATGREFDCDFAVALPSPNYLYIRVLNTTLPTVGLIFESPIETKKLTYCAQVFEDYTKLRSISAEGDAYRVTLEKE